MCSLTPSFFVCSVIFVPQIGLLALYKYWPSPTFMFFSLIIISLLLVTSACLLILKSYSLYTQTEHQILTFSYTSSGIPYSFFFFFFFFFIFYFPFHFCLSFCFFLCF